MRRIKDYFSLDSRRLKKINNILASINRLKEEMSQLSDAELQQKTDEFKERLAAGETLDHLLVEAFALVREADKRILGLFPYDVQVIGAIVLHQGNTAEMKTGEGKTLTATMPLYLNALEGKGAMLVTNNDYLAIRDANEMRPVYEFLGLSVGVGVGGKANQKMKTEQKRQIYASDIIYTTNSALGFDYLTDNLAASKDKKFLRPFHYAIVDEADAVLLDMAQTPLVISGSPRVQSNLYAVSDEFILSLVENEGYHFDKEHKETWLKHAGVKEAERYFSLENCYVREQKELVRHINLALQAHRLFENGKDYVVDDDEVKLLDKHNGRMLKGTKLQGGVHQAIEQKEHVKVSPEMRAMASITYQNLFLLFPKLSGMTGTAKVAEDELIETFNMEVIRIPTNRPIKRIDYPDKIYTTLPEKIHAIIAFVKKVHATGQPILLVAGTVRMSELFSEILLLEGIPHSLLNAQSALKEAQMIAEAGQLHAVTVATNMAGRGTDIKLGEGVAQLGGLAVIGTERMNSQRMDLQLRGRSGRQGDPGFSQFFVSFEDDLIIESGPQWAQDYFKKQRHHVDESNPKELHRRKFRKLFQQAQEASDSKGKSSRGSTLEFDASVKIQREYIYKERDSLIEGTNENYDIAKIITSVLKDFVKETDLTTVTVTRFILDNMTYQFGGIDPSLNLNDASAVVQLLEHLAEKELARKRQLLGADFRDFERIAVLKAVDESWIEEVDYLQQLRTVATARQTAQRNPIYEYHKEALISYRLMKKEIKKLAFKNLLLSDVSYTDKDELKIYFV